MQIQLAKMAIVSTLVLSGTAALQAQNYGEYPPYQGYPYDSGRVYDRPDPRSYGFELFERVEADLNRAADNSYGSRRAINHARKEVQDVQHQFSRGRFDGDEIGEAISSVQHAVNSDSVDEIDRSILLRDLAQMQRFRAASYSRYRSYDDGYYR